MNSRSTFLRHFFLLILFFFSVGSARPESVQALKDINREGPNFSSNPTDIRTVGAYAFAILDDARHGRELWRSDGTAAGTSLVKDLVPGAESPAHFRWLVNSNGTLYFLAWMPTTVDLWKSYGTAATTVLVKKLPRSDLRYEEVNDLHPFRGGVVFSVNSITMGREPWISDGTEAGTHLLKDIVPGAEGSSANGFIEFGGQLLFSAYTQATGWELWRSDGTNAGTELLQDIVPGAGSSGPYKMRPFNNYLYFDAEDPAHGRELWRTDGTAHGARLVADFRAGATSSRPEVFGTFQQRLIVTSGRGARVYLMDRAEKFTLLTANSNISYFEGFVTTPAYLYFRGHRNAWSQNIELWQSNGSRIGTHATPAPGQSPFTAVGPMAKVGSKLVFVSQGATWVTDGTPKGAIRLPASGAADFEPVGSVTLFAADHPTAGRELMVTDGTPAGTRLVKDVAKGNSSSDPTQPYDVNGSLYFTAAIGDRRYAFISDGTPSGTVPLLANPVSMLIPLNNKLVLQMNDGLYAFDLNNSNMQRLAAGLFLGPIWTTVGKRLIFARDQGPYADHPVWSTDGTPEGTFQLSAGLRIPDYPYPTPIPFVNLGLLTLIQVYDGSSYGLYATDGTNSGTRKVLPFGNGYPAFFDSALYGNELYFPMNTELWKTDGKSAIKVFTFPDYIANLEFQADTLAVATYGNTTRIWWSRDRASFTSFQTVHQRLYSMVASGGRMLFSAGNELWSTSGTEETTAKIGDAGITEFVRYGSILYYAGISKSTGTELWVTDGTSFGTRLIKDIYPGVYSSGPAHFCIQGKRLFFSANDGRIGRELWRLVP